MAEVLRSSQAAIDAKLGQWNALLSEHAESRDQTEQVRAHTDTELRRSYDDLRLELQVTTISTCSDIYLLFICQFGCNVSGASPSPQPLEFVRAKKRQNSARFRTTSDFDREYLRNASIYRQAENGFINYNLSHVRQKKMVNFGVLTTELTRLMFTHPNSLFSEGHISAPRG